MAESAQIAKVSTKHEAIIAHLILHPEMKMGEVARTFQVTPAWLSTIIHSDAFQDQLKKRQDQFFSAATVTVVEKLTTLAHLALDKMIDTVQIETDHQEIRETAALALDRIGYSAQKGIAPLGGVVNQQNNFYGAAVTPEMLAASRTRILERQGITAHALAPTPTSEELPASGDRPTGGYLIEASPLSSGLADEGQARRREEV